MSLDEYKNNINFIIDHLRLIFFNAKGIFSHHINCCFIHFYFILVKLITPPPPIDVDRNGLIARYADDIRELGVAKNVPVVVLLNETVNSSG